MLLLSEPHHRIDQVTSVPPAGQRRTYPESDVETRLRVVATRHLGIGPKGEERHEVPAFLDDVTEVVSTQEVRDRFIDRLSHAVPVVGRLVPPVREIPNVFFGNRTDGEIQ